MNKTFKFSLTEQDHCWYLNYSQYVAPWGIRRRRQAALVTSGFLACAILLYRVVTGTSSITTLPYELVSIGLLLLVYQLLLSRAAKRSIPATVARTIKLQGNQAPIGRFTLILSNEGLREINESGTEVSDTWTNIRRIESSGQYVICIGTHRSYLFPIPTEIERAELLESAIQYWKDGRGSMKSIKGGSNEQPPSELALTIKQGVLSGVALLIMLTVVQVGLHYFSGSGLNTWTSEELASQIQVQRSELIDTGNNFAVIGEIGNNAEKSVHFVELKINFFDAAGVFTEQCQDWISEEIAPHKVILFKVSCDESAPERIREAARHEVQITSARGNT